MKRLFLPTLTCLMLFPSTTLALTPAERAADARVTAIQGAAIRVVRTEAKGVFKALDPYLSDTTALSYGDIIALSPSGLSSGRRIGDIECRISRTGSAPEDVTATPTTWNKSGIRVYVGLLAAFGIHTNPDLTDDEVSALIKGGKKDTAAATSTHDVCDLACAEAVSLLESKPTTFLHANTSALQHSDAGLIKLYLQRAHAGLTGSRIEAIIEMIRKTPIGTLFFTQLLSSDESERLQFFQCILDSVLPYGAELTNEEIAKDLNYPLFKHAFLSILPARSLSSKK